MKNITALFSIVSVGFLLFVAEPTATRAAAPAPVLAESCPYTVVKGDTLIKIAAALTGSSRNYPLIIAFNALTSDRIAPGQVLHIPFDLLLPKHRCQPEATPVPTPLPKITVADEPAPAPEPMVIPIPTLTPPPKDKKFLAEIEAFVFEDANGNRRFDEGEPGVAGVKLILVKGRVDQPPLIGTIGVTNENGKYVFKNVEPGPRAVGLYETTLPPEVVLISESTVVVTVPEGGKSYVTFAGKIEKDE
ncbi:hypothetical protein U27_01313 [Candidatus Vecturithrix granuli]|uniref:LysM domain-containing protein n=1 Tax=Vecturithrix granuli TaxID=1499967 RepID=A0A081CA08_VECG1|nr:hypothetical protein U27_01313 [Candidatus Vecturithrix granuli]